MQQNTRVEAELTLPKTPDGDSLEEVPLATNDSPIPWADVTPEAVRAFSKHPPDPLAVELAEQMPPESRILDLGCGAGRHLGYLLEKGHRPVGIDPGPGQRQAAQEAYPSVPIFPLLLHKPMAFQDGEFDAMLSTYAIYHGLAETVRWTISEGIRVVRAGGRVYMNLISTRDFKYGVGPQYEDNTFGEVRPGEHGEMHHFFELKEVIEVCRPLHQVAVSHEEKPLDLNPEAPAVKAWDKICAHWIVRGIK